MVDDALRFRLGDLRNHLQTLRINFDAETGALIRPDLAVLEFEALGQVIPDAALAGELEQHGAGERTARVRLTADLRWVAMALGSVGFVLYQICPVAADRPDISNPKAAPGSRAVLWT